MSKIGPSMRLERMREVPPAPEHLRPLLVGSKAHEDWIASLSEEDYGVSYWFWCRGCETNHRYTTKLAKGANGPCWGFNGNMERPTFTPSLLYNATQADPARGLHRCHLFLTDGQIRYLNDCTHGLAGKTVPLGPVD